MLLKLNMFKMANQVCHFCIFYLLDRTLTKLSVYKIYAERFKLHDLSNRNDGNIIFDKIYFTMAVNCLTLLFRLWCYACNDCKFVHNRYLMGKLLHLQYCRYFGLTFGVPNPS